jgi:hypothetical protein
MVKRITHEEGCWLRYQLKLNGYTQDSVALVADCTEKMVSHFLCGRKDSVRVRTAFCKVLGYGSFDRLIDTRRGQTPPEGGEA